MSVTVNEMKKRLKDLKSLANSPVTNSFSYAMEAVRLEKKIKGFSDSKLVQINQLKQSIHNLKMRFPIGIRSIDDSCDEKLKRLEGLLIEVQKCE